MCAKALGTTYIAAPKGCPPEISDLQSLVAGAFRYGLRLSRVVELKVQIVSS